jgi:hypothetical protein
MPRSRAVVAVDEQLFWLIDLPEAPAGAACAASPAGLALLGARFAAQERAVADAAVLGLAGVITTAVLEALQELPELPFVGEPFGGDEGTD